MNILTFFRYHIFSAILIILFVNGCNSGGELPVERLKKSLKHSTDYSIILEDMKESGNFIPSYSHKYRIINGEQNSVTSWLQVPEKYYRKTSSLLGMAIAGKADGKEINSAAPPGYQYVGNSKYGQWRQDHRGSSFWEFYGKYALFSTLLGTWNRPIYRNDYQSYRNNRSQGNHFFGRNNQYGTNGSVTKKNKPNFYARKQARQKMRTSSFNNRVSKRIGRTRTGFRGRAGGFGK